MKNDVDITVELRTHIARKYKTQKDAALAWGVSCSFVSSVLSGRKLPNEKMLRDAGFERVPAPVQYVRAK